VVEPNLRAGHTIALLMVLSQGKSKYVNGRTSGRTGKVLAEGPFALADEGQLQASIWSKLGSSRSNASASTSRFSLRISLEAETNRRRIDSERASCVVRVVPTSISISGTQRIWSGHNTSTRHTAV